jgi:hypothetical protein
MGLLHFYEPSLESFHREIMPSNIPNPDLCLNLAGMGLICLAALYK